MCGIAGLVNWGDRETLARMNNVQAHRGPDDEGIWETRLPDGLFFYRHVLAGGFLEGKEAFVYHFLHALWYPMLIDVKYVKYLELKRQSQSKSGKS